MEITMKYMIEIPAGIAGWDLQEIIKIQTLDKTEIKKFSNSYGNTQPVPFFYMEKSVFFMLFLTTFYILF